MRRVLFIFLLCLFCWAVVLNAQEKRLYVVHTNDTHSCVEPVSPNLSDTAMANKGGFLRRAAMVEHLRSQHSQDMLLFDCGDFSQGSVYYNLFRGEVEVQLMNLMGYDAGLIGNHEFDFGMENLARLIRMAQFPFVCSNYDFTGTPCEGLVHPYLLIQRNGLRIGVIGVGPELQGLVARQNYGKTRFLPPAKAVRPIVDKLRKEEQCDFVICLSHLGWGEGKYQDPAFIRETDGIDLVLGGHTHTYFNRPRYVKNRIGIEIPCNQMGKNGRFLGTMEFVFEPYSK